VSNKFAPTIIAAQPGYHVAEPRYSGDNYQTFDSFELIPIIAWTITPHLMSDHEQHWAETRPVTTHGYYACLYYTGWMIKLPDGRFMGGEDGEIFADEKAALVGAKKASVAETETKVTEIPWRQSWDELSVTQKEEFMS
jgi:hypothetical protein